MRELVDKQLMLEDVKSWVAMDSYDQHWINNMSAWIEYLPTVEEVSDEDCISRRDAIEAIEKAKTAKASDGELYVAKINAEMNIQLLPSVQPEQRWIPCSERLPENGYVLISKKPTMISGDKWSVAIAIRMTDPRSGKIQWRDSGFGVIQDDKVLAWMPLPASYKGE